MANDHVMTLDKQLAALEVTTAKGFQEQRQRLDKIDRRLDTIDGSLGKIDGRLDAVDGSLGKVDGRLDQHTSRFDRLEDRISTLDSKLDVVAESIRGDVTTIRELVTGFMGEMRRTTDSIRKEHAADRRLTRLALADHVVRIRKFEGGAPGADN